MKRTFIGLTLLWIGAAIVVTLFRSGMGAHTSNQDVILNRLRVIDGAKHEWVTAHPDVKAEELTQQDLARYLDKDFWKQAVAGEVYLIHGVNEPPEALMTRDVDSVPKGMKLRFSPDGKIEVRPNKRSALDARMAVCIQIKAQWPGASESER